jgi:hypothetical protein
VAGVGNYFGADLLLSVLVIPIPGPFSIGIGLVTLGDRGVPSKSILGNSGRRAGVPSGAPASLMPYNSIGHRGEKVGTWDLGGPGESG